MLRIWHVAIVTATLVALLAIAPAVGAIAESLGGVTP